MPVNVEGTISAACPTLQRLATGHHESRQPPAHGRSLTAATLYDDHRPFVPASVSPDESIA